MNTKKMGRPNKEIDDIFIWDILMKIRAGAKTAKEAGTTSYYLSKEEINKYILTEDIVLPNKVGRPKKKLVLTEQGKEFIENYKVKIND